MHVSFFCYNLFCLLNSNFFVSKLHNPELLFSVKYIVLLVYCIYFVIMEHLIYNTIVYSLLIYII